MRYTTRWSAGDRVYSLTNPQLTGTVERAAGDGALCLVRWDAGASAWMVGAELDWYTRPVEVN